MEPWRVSRCVTTPMARSQPSQWADCSFLSARHRAPSGSTVSLPWTKTASCSRAPTFQWLREALLKPLRPGSRVVVISSGAALNANGSPLSGGYAGAKATQRFITGYAQDEAARAGLGISFATVLPQFAPLTSVGRPAVQAYAGRAG